MDRRSLAECWPWTAALRKGYGTFKLGIGDFGVPEALHGCDHPPCCNAENPAHVHEGTPLLNMQEKVQRGRCVNPAGELSARAVLSNAQAEEIRRRRGEPQHLLAVEFRVSQITISRVQRGLRYGTGR